MCLRRTLPIVLPALIAALALPLHAPPAAAAPAPSPTPPTDQPVGKGDDTINDELNRFETARVIITLSTNVEPESSLSTWQEYVDRRIALATDQNAVNRTLAATDSTLLRTLSNDGLISARVDRDGFDALAASPSVGSIQLDELRRPALDSTIPIVQADTMHSAGYRGAGQAIAIIDTGVQYDHPIFSDGASGSRVIAGACYSTNDASRGETSLCPNGQETDTGPTAGDDCPTSVSGCGHGTHVAGIAAGGLWTTGDARTIIGVAPQADIIAINVFTKIDVTGLTDTPLIDYYPCLPASDNCYDPCDGSYPCALTYDSDIVAGLAFVETLVATPALIENNNLASVNMSLGGGTPTATACDNNATARAVRRLKANNVATVIASGNNGSSTGVSNPGCISDAITVGATTDADTVASYTNTVEGLVDLYAPGSSVLSSLPDGSSANYNGTSMAAPHVAGAVVLMAEHFPGNTVDATLTQLQLFGTPVSTRGAVDLGYSVPRIRIADAALSADNYLVVTLTGTGSGTVTADSIGINCGDVCSTVLEGGPETVTLAASPDDLSNFVGWTGCDSTNGANCTITISSATPVTAEFSGPINNAESDPIDITFSSSTRFTSTGSTMSATDESGEPTPSCVDTFGSTVWYRYVAESDGQLAFSTEGSDYDTVVAVYGSTSAGLNEIGCNDDIDPGVIRTSNLTVDVARGTTYLIQIGGYDAEVGSLTLSINADLEPLVTLNVNRLGDGTGAISSDQPDGDCSSSDSTCEIDLVTGTTITLTATADTNSAFVAWSDACAAPETPTCSLTVNTNTTVTAWFRSTISATAPADSVIASLPEQPTAISSAEVQAGGTLQLAAPAATFDPHERVVVTLHSDPVVLADVTAQSDGSMTSELNMPVDTPSGNHQIVALGQVSGSGLRATVTIPANDTFVAVEPGRVVDTRLTGVVVDGVSRFRIADAPVVGDPARAGELIGVPVGAGAVALNVTVTGTQAPGFVSVYPCAATSDATPNVSNVNYVPGATVANSAVVSLSSDGFVCVSAVGATHVLIDVAGYFESGFESIDAGRVVDTRLTGVVVDGVSRFRIADAPVVGDPARAGELIGVPVGAGAVALNVTVTGTQAPGFVSVYPCAATSDATPNVSNVNYVAGATVANSAVVSLSSDGFVCVSAVGATHVLIDVAGYFTSGLTTVEPGRVVDTRLAGEVIDDVERFVIAEAVVVGDPTRAGDSIGVPVGATAVAINITVTGTQAPGFVSVYPCASEATTPPNVSNVNYVESATVANSAIMPLSTDGAICVNAVGATNVLIDISSYLTSN